MSQTLLDIVKDCDNFPYYTDNPALYTTFLQNYYYAFKVSRCSRVLGHVPKSIVQAFEFPATAWEINHETQELILERLTTLMSNTLHEMTRLPHAHPLFSKLKQNWRNETFPIRDPDGSGSILLEIERSASALFEILTAGVQLTCFVDDPQRGLLLWIARRSRTKQTYPGMLDNSAAGGLETGLARRPVEGVVREAVEETSLDQGYVRKRVKGAGALSYYYVKGGGDSGAGLLQPEVEYLYELELDPGVIPVPGDGEVEGFYLWGVEEVKVALGRGEFKLSSAIAIIDFFVRHGVVTPENERDYFEIITRLHRRLEFLV
ncbi:hypothetical protein BDW62DRAFT_206658 [Aspergillus aurantiobrunneus]